MKKLTVKDIAMLAMMVAVIETTKAALSFLPNIELTTFWLIMFALYFGAKVFIIVPVFILVEACIYGFQLWIIMYLYIWPFLVALALIFKKQTHVLFWAILSASFGLSFGFLCSFPYFFIGLANGLQAAINGAISWWLSGLLFDLVHCGGNFVLMMALYYPVRKVMGKLKVES